MLELESNTVKGSPQEPMSEDELLAKFYDCMSSGLGASREEADRLADAVMHIDTASDAAAALLRAFPAPRTEQAPRAASVTAA